MPAKAKTTAAAGSICAIAGSDEAEVKRAATARAEELMPASAGEFSRDVIDGCAENVDQAATRIHEAVEALLTLPFFGGAKLVWLRSANFLGDSPMGRSARVVEALEKLHATLSAGLPEGVKFLLSAIDVDKRRSFYKALGKLGKLEVFDKLDSSRTGWEEEAAGLVERRARERGLQVDAEALELFTLLTGGDSRAIDNELEKLDLFLGRESRRIGIDQVRQLVPLSRAGVIFELGNVLMRRDLPRALALVDQLLRQGESAVGILLVAIVPTVRNLLLAKDLMERHALRAPGAPFHFTATLNRLPESALAHLPRKKDGTFNAYPLGFAAMHAHRFEVEELKKLLNFCLAANVGLVTSQRENRVVLSELIARFAQKPAEISRSSYANVTIR